MVNKNYTRYEASDRSYYALLRKGIHKQAVQADFSEIKIAHLDLIVAEITSNLDKYTNGGEVLCAVQGLGNDQYMEIIALDSGPGFNDLALMMGDGISSGSTLGHGLGSIKRMSDFFSIYSLKGWGTILVSRLYKTDARTENRRIVVRGIVVPKPPEKVSGDGFTYKFSERYFKLMLMDGLGHGPEANKAVEEAFSAFKLCPLHDPADIVRYMHPPLKKTRGGVGTVLVYDGQKDVYSILGVGNIASKIVGNTECKNIMPYNGIIGHNIPNTMTSHEIPAKDYKFIVMCSDGIKTRWDITKYPHIQRYDPIIIAAAIYKDFARHTDDMSVVIIKINKV
ncbi:serine/threonine protein kinase [Pedobacter sp. SAFR-022]|uniref:serine/threonine protein kinase n=1 Tax=Pedobacter sp. SAFR-022 TaxID=3436861 RepID=UPI003F81B6F1